MSDVKKNKRVVGLEVIVSKQDGDINYINIFQLVDFLGAAMIAWRFGQVSSLNKVVTIWYTPVN